MPMRPTARSANMSDLMGVATRASAAAKMAKELRQLLNDAEEGLFKTPEAKDEASEVVDALLLYLNQAHDTAYRVFEAMRDGGMLPEEKPSPEKVDEPGF